MADQGRLQDEELIEGLDLCFLKWTGIWESFNHFRATGKRNRVLKMYMIFHVLCLIPATLSSFAGPFVIGKSLEGLTVIMIAPASTFSLIVKFDFLWSNTGFAVRLLEMLKRDYAPVPGPLRMKADEILCKAARRSNRLGRTMLIVNTWTVIMWCFSPILRSEFFRHTLGVTFFGEPLPGQNKILGYWYPVDHTATPWTQIIFIYEFLWMIWAGTIWTWFELLLVVFIVMLTGHLEVLHLMVSELKGDPQLAKRLPECIQFHDKLARTGNEMSRRFTLLITLVISAGFMIMIFGIFNFVLGSNNGDWFNALKFMFLHAILEMFMYCYTSDDLGEISSKLCNGVYSSEWYDKMNLPSRKALLMMMIRTRKPLVLKAWCYPVNIELMNNILHTAYSTTMVMLKTSSDE